MSDQPVIREPFSNAEFYRFVQEAQGQRALADARGLEIARLRAALEWYADPANSDRGPNVIPWTTNLSRDRGERARAALGAGAPAAAPGVLRSAACEPHGVRLCATCAGYEGGSPYAAPGDVGPAASSHRPADDVAAESPALEGPAAAPSTEA